MPTFPAFLGMMRSDETGFVIDAAPDWGQGRTLYGGISAALCLEAVARGLPGLPPLRAAQFTFAGPASGALHIQPTVLRKGKSTVVVGVDLAGDAGLAARAILTYGAARQSALRYRDMPAPAVASPDACAGFFGEGPAPVFLQHFEVRQAGRAGPVTDAATPEFLVWVRHVAAEGVDPVVALIALADAPPPAAMAMFPRPAPVSTATWAINLLGTPTAEGWHLIRTRGETVEDGYSSQTMGIWDETGVALVSAQQNVAVFV